MKYPEHLNNRIEFIAYSFKLANKSLTEIKIILDEYNNDISDNNIARSSTIGFYNVALQYCFVNEFCKLTEKADKSRSNENYASIEMFLLKYKESLKSGHLAYDDKWLDKMRDIQNSNISVEIRRKRDRQLSHIDKKGEISKFRGLSIEQIQFSFEALNKIYEIINLLTDFVFIIPDNDNRTKNFIIHQSKYKKHCLQME